MDATEAELYGIEDEFEEQFADELEALAELEGPAPRSMSHKVSRFRSQKRTFEEALSAGDLRTNSCAAELKKGCRSQAFPKQTTDDAAPKAKQRRLEATKRLDFGEVSGTAPEDSLQDETVSPGACPEPLDARSPGSKIPAGLGISDIVPLHVTPPEKKGREKILRRAPILDDYINVTSSNGTRVFVVMKEDGAAAEPIGSLARNRQRPLHLLGVPFSYLKEQVTEECRRLALESSQQLTELLNRLGAEEVQDKAPGPGEEDESGGGTEGEAPHSLWVDQFTPRRYIELLSDDYTNRCLLKWLKLWDTLVFGKEKPTKKAPLPSGAQPPFKHSRDQGNKWKTKTQLTEEILEAELDQHNRPKYKVALLCGPPGLGKTTLAHVIAKHAGYNVVEINASDDRSPDVFKTRIEAATQMKSVLGANEKPNCLVIDEIDGAPTASINVLLSIINRKGAEPEERAGGSKRRREGSLLLRPIISICNEQYVPALRLLKQQAFVLNFPSTLQSRLVQRLQEITVTQGMKADIGALTALCEKTDNDIRSCINTLQFLFSRGKRQLNARTVQAATVGLKDQNKGLFAIWQEIFQLPKVQRHPSVPAGPLVGPSSGFGRGAGQTSGSATTQRFHRILHLSISSGEHEKLSQGLFDNFLKMKVKDSNFDSIGVALEWLSFSDLLNKSILHSQSFQLMRYLPFLPVSFHLLFAASSVPRLVYPNSQHEALSKLTQMQNLVDSLVSGIAPNLRSRAGSQTFVLEALCLLLEILSPKLRPVNTQLFSQKEKEQLTLLIKTMLAYNLTYHQERTPEGQYVYKLEPNVEDVCRFPDLPIRKPLTYQAKQLIAREIELEKMRRTEAALHEPNVGLASEASSVPKEGGRRTGWEPPQPKPRMRNSQPSLDQMVKRATVEEKPELDFFGRVIIKKKVAPSSEADQVSEKNSVEKQIGKAIGQSDVWFRFNEGVSNAVRRNMYIKDLF